MNKIKIRTAWVYPPVEFWKDAIVFYIRIVCRTEDLVIAPGLHVRWYDE